MQSSFSSRARRMRAFMKKELYQIRSDSSTFLICIFLPLFLLFLYGYGVSLDVDHLRLGVVMEDSSPEAQSLIKNFVNSPYFDVKIFRDRHVAVEDIVRGSLRGFVVIPSYFSDFLNNPDKIAPIQVIADGSEPNTANFVQNYVQGAFQNYLVQDGIVGSKVNVQSRVWYNEELESRYFLLSGSLAIIMTLIGTLLTSLVVSREWERGTMESLFSTAIRIPELILGKLIPYFILGMVSMCLCALVSVFVFGLPFRGSIISLLIVSSSFLFCAVGLGLMISTLSKNQVVAYQVSLITGFLPSYILSGFLFEISSMPTWIQWLTRIIPAKYFVQCLQTLFLVGDVPYLIWRNIIPMLGIGLLFFVITAKKTVKRLD
jgi:ABC-2 type transport system permease protein